MKRLREHRALIIRDNGHGRERRREGRGDGGEKVHQKRGGEKRDSEC